MNEELRKENEKLETQLEVLINSNKELGTELEHRLKQEKDLKDKLALIQSKLKITDREINLARTKIIPNNIEKWRKLNSCSEETTSGRRKADYVTIKVEEGFNLNECLERWNNEANNQLMGSGANTTIHAWLDHWNVQYTGQIAQELRPKRKKVRREAKCEREMRETFSAKGEGGTTRQFLSEVWRQMSNIKQATVRGNIDQSSETASSNIVKLFPSESNNGYLMPLSDDFLDSKTRGDGYVDYQETINAKYRAIGRCILVALLGQNPIAHHVLPDIYRNYLILGIDPTDERYAMVDLVHQLYAMFSCKESGDESAENKFDTVLETIKIYGMEESGASAEKLIRDFAKEWYIDGYKQALDAMNEGLTCNGKVDISQCFFNIRPEVFSAVMFAKKEEDIRVQDVLVSLELGEILDSEGELLPQDEDQAYLFSVDERKEKNDETRVSGMLVDFIRECAEQEGQRFLVKFIQFVTGYPYVPGSGLQIMTVEFARYHDLDENGIAGEMSDDALPMAHTCPRIIKFPFTAYHRNYGKLKQKLEMALEYMSNFNMN